MTGKLVAPVAAHTSLTAVAPIADTLLEAQLLVLVNTHRQSLGLGVLVSLASLTASAEWKSADMAQYGYLGHDDPAEPGRAARTWSERLAAFGYQPQLAAENIADGYQTADTVLAAWLASPGHKENLEAPFYTATGIGAVASTAGTVYWTQDFGVGAPDTPPGPPATSPLQGWITTALPELEQGTVNYTKWRKLNKADAARFDAYLADPTPPFEGMTTELGRFLVDTIRILAAAT